MAAGLLDVRLINPSLSQLTTILKRACRVANGVLGPRNPKLERNEGFWDRFARDCLRQRQGRRRSCKAGGYQTPEVIACWWTDPVGRKHFRVIGRVREPYNRMRREGELRNLPPWWHVYPESVLAARSPSGQELLLACCRCGMVGTPDSLGWMGDTCGPCYDRQLEGGETVGGYGQFAGWGRGLAGCYFTFSHDGRKLVGPHVTSRLRVLDRHTGAEVLRDTLAIDISAVVAGDGSYVFLTPDGAVSRWDGGDGRLVQVLPRHDVRGRSVVASDGRHVLQMSTLSGYAADLSEEKPGYRGVYVREGYVAFRFVPDGSRVYGVTSAGDLMLLDVNRGNETVVYRDTFGPLSRYGNFHELVIAPDGSAVALVRELYYPPVFKVVLLRLDGSEVVGPPCELPLPFWYRPTALAFAPDGRHLLTADSQSGWVGFWTVPGNHCLGFVRALTEDLTLRGGQLLFSPDGRSLAMLYSGSDPDRGSVVAVWPWPEVLQALRI
jgi:hypothetical protein